MKKQIHKKINKTVGEKISDVDMYVLKLFVSGVLPNSVRAIVNVKAFCKQYLPGNHDLEIIDIYQQPKLAIEEDIIAVPVLIKKFPLPEEMVIGDLSDIEIVLKGLKIFNPQSI